MARSPEEDPELEKHHGEVEPNDPMQAYYADEFAAYADPRNNLEQGRCVNGMVFHHSILDKQHPTRSHIQIDAVTVGFGSYRVHPIVVRQGDIVTVSTTDPATGDVRNQAIVASLSVIQDQTGRYFIFLNGTSLQRDHGGHMTMGVFRDITDNLFARDRLAREQQMKT